MRPLSPWSRRAPAPPPASHATPASAPAHPLPVSLELTRKGTSPHGFACSLTWLAAYAHLRGRALTDGLVELLVETVHAIGARAERRVELKVINEFKKVTGKTN